METKPLGGWCCTAAWAAEGCTWLAALLPRLATLWLWNGVLCGFVPLFSPAPVAVAGGLLLTGWLSGAMRLGRFAWYAALTDCRPGEWPGATAFVNGWRRIGAAIGWHQQQTGQQLADPIPQKIQIRFPVGAHKAGGSPQRLVAAAALQQKHRGGGIAA